MAKYLWWSLVETIAPDAEQPAQKSDKPLSCTIGDQPLDGEGERGTNLGLASKAALELSKATEDPIIAQPRGSRKSAGIVLRWIVMTWGEIVIMPPQDLASQIAVRKITTAPEHHQEDPEDMLHDVKLYLPSVALTEEEVDLCKDVFDFLPGTVNTKRGAATYESRDQPFHFMK